MVKTHLAEQWAKGILGIMEKKGTTCGTGVCPMALPEKSYSFLCNPADKSEVRIGKCQECEACLEIMEIPENRCPCCYYTDDLIYKEEIRDAYKRCCSKAISKANEILGGKS